MNPGFQIVDLRLAALAAPVAPVKQVPSGISPDPRLWGTPRGKDPRRPLLYYNFYAPPKDKEGQRLYAAVL